MSEKQTNTTVRDFVYILGIAMLMATSATLGYNWPEYNEYDLKKAESEYVRAEAQHRSAYSSALMEAQHLGYNNPEYKRLKEARYDVRMPKGGNTETRIAHRKRVCDELAVKADSVKNKIIQDYIASDSAYLATKQDMQQAAEHLEFVRAEVQRADSISKLPQHKIMWHNIKETFQKKR